MPTPVDLVQEVKSLTHELVERVDRSDTEQKSRNEELTSKMGVMAAEHKSAIDAITADLNKATDALEAFKTEARVAAQRPPLNGKGEQKDRAAQEAFLKVMRKGGDIHSLSTEERALICKEYMPGERKALYAADATTGGFFASTDFVNELQAFLLLQSPMRSICRTMTTSGEKVQMPSLLSDTTAAWATEQATFADSADPTVGMISIPVHEMRGLMKISQQNLEDSQFDLEGLIRDRLMKVFAQKEGAAFVKGDGNGKPQGILSYPIKASSGYTGGSAGKNNVVDAIPYVATGQSANITADSVLNVLMDLKADYSKNATYIFTRGTLNSIRLLKDSQNRPLWQPFGGANLPATIYDRPYVEMPDMPEIAANAYCIAVGDFSNYLIVDRATVNFNVQQLSELYAAQGLIGFIARKRVGGGVLLPESLRVLKASAS